jgi:peptidoglycan/LPS O-acetylase OafA/YrhL
MIPSQNEKPTAGERLRFLDALRAVASVLILLHHFALYPPMSVQAETILAPSSTGLANTLDPPRSSL